MVARGKPFKLNDFLSSFEEQFEPPNFVERSITVPCQALCPLPLGSLHYPGPLLDFARGQLQVCWAVLGTCVSYALISIFSGFTYPKPSLPVCMHNAPPRTAKMVTCKSWDTCHTMLHTSSPVACDAVLQAP